MSNDTAMETAQETTDVENYVPSDMVEQNENDCTTQTLLGIPQQKNVRTHGVGLTGGSRDSTSIRCDRNLWKRFKTEIVPYFGSTCKAIETMIMAYLGATETVQKIREKGGYTQGNTMDREDVPPVPNLYFGELHVHRNLGRERRNLPVDADWMLMKSIGLS